VPFNLTSSFVATANTATTASTATASCTYAKPAKNEHLFTIFIYLLTFILIALAGSPTMSAAFWQRIQRFASEQTISIVGDIYAGSHKHTALQAI